MDSRLWNHLFYQGYREKVIMPRHFTYQSQTRLKNTRLSGILISLIFYFYLSRVFGTLFDFLLLSLSCIWYFM